MDVLITFLAPGFLAPMVDFLGSALAAGEFNAASTLGPSPGSRGFPFLLP